MPLFIDLHIDSSLTPELITTAHLADKEIQEKYGVRYLQILLNQPQGYLFCVVEGPDKESCARVHAEAHGNIACNIIEITAHDIGALLAGKQRDGNDFTIDPNGAIDTGSRAILSVSITGRTQARAAAMAVVRSVTAQHKGHNPEALGPGLTALFTSSTDAMNAAVAIRQKIGADRVPVELRIGVAFGPPLEKEGAFFGRICRLSKRLSLMAGDNSIFVSAKAAEAYQGDIGTIDSIRVAAPGDEAFITEFMNAIDQSWDNCDTTVSTLAMQVGMSRSQLTRKLQSTVLMSPNEFLHEVRLRHALQMVEEGKLNIAEITMATGFSNPSYFTKCFRERYGVAPSALAGS